MSQHYEVLFRGDHVYSYDRRIGGLGKELNSAFARCDYRLILDESRCRTLERVVTVSMHECSIVRPPNEISFPGIWFICIEILGTTRSDFGGLHTKSSTQLALQSLIMASFGTSL